MFGAVLLLGKPPAPAGSDPVPLFTSNGAGGVTFMFAGAAPNPQFEDNQDGTIGVVSA